MRACRSRHRRLFIGTKRQPSDKTDSCRFCIAFDPIFSIRNELTTTVYPVIVRGVALLGIDTVATPIDERRALWAAMATEFPMNLCEEMVYQEIGLADLTDALRVVLDGAARGRILVDPNR